jgi:homoserine/homoserine lactone efflux protein
MKPEVWGAFFAACWLIALSPGAGALLAMSHGQAYGVRKTSATIAGQQAGLLLLLLAAGFGAGALLVASPLAFWALKLIGATYLVYLGITQWHNQARPSVLHSESAGHARSRGSAASIHGSRQQP